MRVALLSYRSKPHCGGQGVYVRHLSRELAALGHDVEVFSGQPYPELDDGVTLVKVPSLDLYRDDDPFRFPHPREIRDAIDLLELGTMWTAGFPEPLTFSLRVARLLRDRAGEFDVVHDNQCLGYGLLRIADAGLPLVATIHHPITRDRELDLASAPTLRRRITLRRWYGFLRMQARVARRIPTLLTVSKSSEDDIRTAFDIPDGRLRTIPLGVDTEIFAPPSTERVSGRIVCVASADAPLKGVANLLEAVAKLRTERQVELVLVTKLAAGGVTEKLIEQLAIGDSVRTVSGIDDGELAGLLGSAQVAAVPSLYEGFSLPAVEAMACATPLVASRAGAIPEVVGDAGILVPPGDSEQLAAALARVLDDPAEQARLGSVARARVLERFSWAAVAARTAQAYRDTVAAQAGRTEV
ncbi:glycosyl transferase family 1 [Rhodococcus ruber Chol-4]|uniref:Putative glycosyltransferase n=1 Tax=Rhodococcus ruber TaxID=1830 RepID=A0A098BRU1_9NOCA|nr:MULTISPECIES: glycosyltransferase family 4 protein [Rhodococcus]MDO2379884.1 glycosyltransferase family 4 protein [Rhodococcus ruber]RIK14064.1 MAG: glycosyltransferase family 1 protein [Acidobacteriota bacterium]ATQ30949.1 glycosyltransferase family 1 protein [Rhodococcus ruber]AUM16425.1 glycosyltransferase family 1 protein [Rhodococcus ruber]AWG97891.1 glycosyltransferase family 1 protein [Rhodococcus ruber]